MSQRKKKEFRVCNEGKQKLFKKRTFNQDFLYCSSSQTTS